LVHSQNILIDAIHRKHTKPPRPSDGPHCAGVVDIEAATMWLQDKLDGELYCIEHDA
jgi:hypothetical protein